MGREPVTGWDAPNPELWVRLDPTGSTLPDVRWAVAGSSSTFRGRFHVCSVDGDLHTTTSYDQLVEMSPLAAVWIDGFLHGQVATLVEFLGEDDTLEAAAGEADEERLRRWNETFLRRGVAPPLDRLPRREPRLSSFPGPSPWCFVGGVFRVWDGTDWAVADPQPPSDGVHGRLWPGSACEREGGHQDELLPPDLEIDDLSVCPRCHHVQQTL